ncbi:MAG TPA: excinuclease ABC subunit C, partial [Tianweitania sediminis]|nr:excinuclease ABC subunit C [Tianweitania sediminis]
MTTEPPRLHQASSDIAGFMPGRDEDDESLVDDGGEAISIESAGSIDWLGTGGDAAGLTGPEAIQVLVKRLPNAPGVYRMM